MIKLFLEDSKLQFDKFDILYHGTDLKSYEKIKNEGFSLKEGNKKTGLISHTNGISFTSLKNEAKEHADWAAEKFKNTPKIIAIDSKNLRILSGDFYNSFDHKNAMTRAYALYKKGKIDGVSFCDKETGDGCEEMEVVIFSLDKIKII